MAEPVVLRRALPARRLGGTTVLDALRWPTPLGAAYRIWFGHGTEKAQIERAGGTLTLHAPRQLGPNLVVTGSSDADLTAPELQLTGGRLPLDCSAPETALFTGLDVIAGLRHHETAETATDWLRWHVERHGAEAAIIVDRSEPGARQQAFADEVETRARGVNGLLRLVLLASPLPLGRPGHPALGAPGTAPRASDRRGTPDPWRAPLAEPLLYDILRWRFLATAGAVAAIDLCELLAEPEDDFGVFEATRQATGGLLPLRGEALFPWRLRKGRAPGYGDHICRRDPPVQVQARWAVAPARCGPENVWARGGVLGLSAPQDETGSYERCLSLLYPDSPVQDLIAKPELAEDEALVDRATGFFAANPVRPPAAVAPVPAVITPLAPPSGRTVVVTCMKNEGPFLLEWLAYHRMIGVDAFLVYTNDCSDGTDRLLDLLQARGLVQRRDNPFRETGLRPQHAALAAARDEPSVQEAGWLLPIDVDEFVNIHVSDGRLPDLCAAMGDANMISLTWRLFGTSDRDTFEDRPVIDQFTRCAPHLIRRPHQAWGFKTLYRNLGLFAEMGVHRPKGLAHDMAPRVRWVNGSGRPMPRGILRTGWRSGIDSYGYDLVTLNHYAVRNAESFLVKRDRGRVNHVTRDQGEGYWFRMNNNAEEDVSIRRHLPALRQAMADLLSDPQIAAAHAACVAAHRARIAALRQDPGQRAFYDLITSDRMKRLSRLHRHFGMNVFLNGPSVIPDSLLETPPAPEFFFNTAPPDGPAAD